MAAGLPIVSSRVGGVPEVAPEGEVAWFSPPGEVEPLCQAMHQAATCERLPEMGRHARQTAIERYDLQVMQRQYQSLYESILNR